MNHTHTSDAGNLMLSKVESAIASRCVGAWLGCDLRYDSSGNIDSIAARRGNSGVWSGSTRFQHGTVHGRKAPTMSVASPTQFYAGTSSYKTVLAYATSPTIPFVTNELLCRDGVTNSLLIGTLGSNTFFSVGAGWSIRVDGVVASTLSSGTHILEVYGEPARSGIRFGGLNDGSYPWMAPWSVLLALPVLLTPTTRAASYNAILQLHNQPAAY